MPIWEMIQVLEAGSGSKSASFNSIFRSRHVTPPSFAKWMSGRINGIWPRKTSFPYGDRDESRFSPDFGIQLSIMGGGCRRSELSQGDLLHPGHQ